MPRKQLTGAYDEVNDGNGDDPARQEQVATAHWDIRVSSVLRNECIIERCIWMCRSAKSERSKEAIGQSIVHSDVHGRRSNFKIGNQNSKKVISRIAIVVCTRQRQRTTGSSAHPLMALVDHFRSAFLRNCGKRSTEKEKERGKGEGFEQVRRDSRR